MHQRINIQANLLRFRVTKCKSLRIGYWKPILINYYSEKMCRRGVYLQIPSANMISKVPEVLILKILILYQEKQFSQILLFSMQMYTMLHWKNNVLPGAKFLLSKAFSILFKTDEHCNVLLHWFYTKMKSLLKCAKRLMFSQYLVGK